MKKFVFIYKGNGSRPAGDMESVNQAWMDWFASMGSAVVDGGNPFDDGGQEVTGSGVNELTVSTVATGYSIVNAEDMDHAVELAKGCPIYSQEGGTASVEVFEALPM